MKGEYNEMVGVPLAHDTQIQIPVGGVMLTVRQLIALAVAAVPAFVALRLIPEPGSLTVALGAMLLAVGTATITKEGIWIGTWFVGDAVGQWLPRSIQGGGVGRAGVRLRGNALEVKNAGKARTMPRQVAGLGALPRLRTVRDGLIEVVPGGWYAVVSIQGPATALNELSYANWSRRCIQWLSQVDCPAQVIAVRDYWDGGSAQELFDQAVVNDSELAREERALCGTVASQSLHLRHMVVFAPGRGTKKGLPAGGLLGPLGTQSAIKRAEAEHVLELALRVALQLNLTCEPVEALQLRADCERTLLAAQEGAAADGAIRLSGRHLATLVVTKLPPSMMPGAVMKAILQTNARSTAALHWFPVAAAQAKSILDQERRMHRATQAKRPGGDVEHSAAEAEVAEFQERLAIHQDAVCRVSLSVTVEARSPDEVDRARDALAGSLAQDGLRSVPVTVPGFWPVATTAPGGPVLRRGLLMTSHRAASCLVPVLGTPLSDPGDPYLGRNMLTGCPAYMDVFSLPNHNMVVFGSTGSGKSASVKTYLARQVMRGTTAIVADPESEYRKLIEALGGRYYELGVDSSLNPLSAGLDEENVDDAAGIVVSALGVMIGETVGMKNGSPIRQLQDADQGWLHEVLTDFFEAWRADARTCHHQPTLTWLCRWIERRSLHSPLIANSPGMQDHYRTLLLRIKRYTQGRYGPIFDRPSSFRIVPGQVTGLGLKSLAMQARAELTPALVMLITSIYAHLGKTPGRMIVVLDEAHHLTNGDADAARAFGMLIRKARKYRVAIFMASQMPKDFLETELGSELAENAAAAIILGIQKPAAALTQDKFDLSDMELSFVCPDYQPGCGIVIAGKERAIVAMDPGEHLWPLVVTGEAAAT